MSGVIGDTDHALGANPSGTDATTFAFVAGLTTPHFDTELSRIARSKANLMAYCDHCMARWFPDFKTA